MPRSNESKFWVLSPPGSTLQAEPLLNFLGAIYRHNCTRHQKDFYPVEAGVRDPRKLHPGFEWTAKEGERPADGGPIGGIPIRTEVGPSARFPTPRERILKYWMC